MLVKIIHFDYLPLFVLVFSFISSSITWSTSSKREIFLDAMVVKFWIIFHALLQNESATGEQDALFDTPQCFFSLKMFSIFLVRQFYIPFAFLNSISGCSFARNGQKHSARRRSHHKSPKVNCPTASQHHFKNQY